jgi:hypothetical protein
MPAKRNACQLDPILAKKVSLDGGRRENDLRFSLEQEAIRHSNTSQARCGTIKTGSLGL